MGQHDDTLASSKGAANALPQHYYVCSPSVPAFIPQSPMAPNPSHYPYLFQETYPQMHRRPSETMMYSGDFLKPPPMSHYVLTVEGNKVPADAAVATQTGKDTSVKQYPWYTALLTFTIWISVAQVAVFIVSVVRGGIAPLDTNINIGPPTATLVDMGAKVSYLMRYNGEGWRFVSAMFVHAGVLHILLNLIAQVRMGVMLEREWGRLKFLTIYLISGVASTLMSCLIQPNTVSVGASGAILGVVGAYFAYIVLIWKTLDSRTKKVQVVQAFFILLVLGLLSLAPFIDTSAHFGGILIGFLLGFTLLPAKDNSLFARWMRVFFGILTFAFFAIGFWYFYAVSTPAVLVFQ